MIGKQQVLSERRFQPVEKISIDGDGNLDAERAVLPEVAEDHAAQIEFAPPSVLRGPFDIPIEVRLEILDHEAKELAVFDPARNLIFGEQAPSDVPGREYGLLV